MNLSLPGAILPSHSDPVVAWHKVVVREQRRLAAVVGAVTVVTVVLTGRGLLPAIVAAGITLVAVGAGRWMKSGRAAFIAGPLIGAQGVILFLCTGRPEVLLAAAIVVSLHAGPGSILAGGALLVITAQASGLPWAAAGLLMVVLGLWIHARRSENQLRRRARLHQRMATVVQSKKNQEVDAQTFEAMVEANAAIMMETQAKMAEHIRGQQHVETELREAKAHLQETNDRLLDAVDRANLFAVRADAANEAKGSFLAMMSHEIRTPLNGVLGTTDLLLEDELTPAQRSSLETIRNSGNNLLAILNDVLDFSRIESGQLALEDIPFSPSRCMRETLQLFYGRAQARRLRLLMTVSPEVPEMVKGDAGRIRQLLANFVSNAIKFTERGEVEVLVDRLAYGAHGRLRLQFSVRDTGIGIPHEKQNLLFKPFSQLDASTQRRYGGTGLGLAICRRLAELMDGEVSVESTVGVGTIFRCNVVVSEAVAEAKDVLPPAPAGRSLVTRILVVDDERINQQIVVAMLNKLGHRAEVARNGLEAIEALRNRDYEIIFMDWHMPEMNGLDATRVIRTELSPAHQPWIIALTASAQPEDREKCIGAGMNDYITKPLNLDALRGAFARFESCESV
jgi:signal transduction histidine kinase/ActR/RegA family two-component response regulator